MPDVGLGTERVWRGRARCESGGGGEIEITRGASERASEAATYSVSEVLGPRVMGLLRVLLHHSSLPSVLPSFLPGHPHSLHRRMKSCLRSAHSLTRGIRTIPEVEPRHGGQQSLQSSVFGNLQSEEARRKSLDLLISDKIFWIFWAHNSCFTLCSRRATHRAAYEQLRSRGRST